MEAMVRDVFQERYGASVREFYPRLLGFECGAVLHAVVGLRSSQDNERFFSEQYLDRSIEQLLATLRGAAVERGMIAEIGNLAFTTTGQARWLIAAVTAYLYAAGFRWVLFTAVTPLYNAFKRLGLSPLHVASASPMRLQDEGASWGRYYETEPQVWVGDIHAGYRTLQLGMQYNHSRMRQLWHAAFIEGARERASLFASS